MPSSPEKPKSATPQNSAVSCWILKIQLIQLARIKLLP